jgi:hypothetical protein
MMSQLSKRELSEAIRSRYLRARKSEKERILDEFVAATGYHRKYAIRILKHGPKPKGLKKKGRQKVYQGEVVQALTQIWEICGRICSKRLKPFLAEITSVLERQNELHLSAETKGLLLSMSCATIDRRLGPARFEHPHGLSTTKPGTLLKKAIPVRTYTPWEDEKPGFVEIDLVAHCGETTEGQYLNTLTATDLATGWTECLAIPNKTQSAVSQAILECANSCHFHCWAWIRIMEASLSTTPSCATVNPSRSPLRVLDLTTRTTRPMSSKRTGRSYVTPLAMIASKPLRNWPCCVRFMPTYAYMSISSSRSSS